MKVLSLFDGISCDNVPIKETAKYKAIGNGWTVDVIAHILKGIKEKKQ